MREMTKNKKHINRIFAIVMIFVMLFSTVVSPMQAYAAAWTPNGINWSGDCYYYDGGNYFHTTWALIHSDNEGGGNFLYYFNSGGYILRGTQEVNGVSHPFTSNGYGIKGSKWFDDGKRYGYTDSNGNNVYITGWFADDTVGEYYYFRSDGNKYADQWAWIDSKLYYFDSDGHMASGTSTVHGTPYPFTQYSGISDADWYTSGGEYYFGIQGSFAVKGWLHKDGYWYYLNPNDGGKMASDEKVDIDGDLYYFWPGGQMHSSGWCGPGDIYYAESSGNLARNKWCKSTDGTKDYWVDSTGTFVDTGWVDGEKYYVREGIKVTGWQAIDNRDYYFYPDDDFATSGYKQGQKVTGFLGVDDHLYYFKDDNLVKTEDSDGNAVNHNYKTGEMTYDGFHTILVNGQRELYKMSPGGGISASNNLKIGNYTYCMNSGEYDAAAFTGWWTDKKYYYNPLEGQPGHNSALPDGAMFTGRQDVTESGTTTTYNFDMDGSLLGSDYHRYLNPYYEVTAGGLYAKGYENTVHKSIQEVYPSNNEKEIPLEYLTINIGAKPADDVKVDMPDAVKVPPQAQTNWSDKTDVSWMWSETKGYVANANEANRDLIINSENGDTQYLSAYYKNIGHLGNRQVSLRITVKDYARMTEGGRDSMLAFPIDQYKPGIFGLNIAWVQLKYELIYEDDKSPVEPDTKGTTTYYDVDVYQSVAINDNTNRGIYYRDVCQLSVGDVEGYGILDGRCIYWPYQEDINHEEYKYEYGFTETFEGNTLIRTFNLQGTAIAGSGGMYNDGQVINNGHLAISKTVKGAASDTNGPIDFDFTVNLTDKNGDVVPLDATYTCEYSANGTPISGAPTTIAFANGVAKGIKLSHGESIKILGLPSGLSYQVTEGTNDKYVTTSTGATGVIAEDQTKTASFVNTEKTTLTLNTFVDGNMGDKNKIFTFKVSINGGTEQTVELKHGQSKTFYVLAGDSYKIEEVLPSGYTIEIAGSDTEDEAAGKAGGTVNPGGESVTYTNIRNMAAPTGVESDNPPYAIMVIGALMILMVWIQTSFGRCMRKTK